MDIMIPERKQYFMRTDERGREGKLSVLQDIYNIIVSSKSIVFCNTRAAAEKTQQLMNALKCPCSILHGKLEDTERDRAMDQFRGKHLAPGQKPSRVLVCTDVLARGVDIPNVNLVVNFDMPVEFTAEGGGFKKGDPVTYAHRIARCARGGRVGIVINFIDNDHEDARILGDIVQHFAPGNRAVQADLVKRWGVDPNGDDEGVRGLWRQERPNIEGGAAAAAAAAAAPGCDV